MARIDGQAPRLPRGSDFQPPAWLGNPHLQTILASSGLRRRLLAGRRQRVARGELKCLLVCGAGVRLGGLLTRQDGRSRTRALVVLLHGWEGSVRSNYMLDSAASLLDAGFDVFRLNFRDHGDTHALNRGLFHSCRIDEVVGAVRAIQARFEPDALALAGFSLGGNFALRVALRAPGAGLRLRRVVAICPVVSPGNGLYGLEEGFFLYRRYFLHKWRRSLRRKQRAFPDVEWFTPQEFRGDLRALTRSLVLRHTDFGTLENYLDGYSVAADRLAGLQVPTTILTAADDPVIPIADFEALALPACVDLDIAPRGGHCGFLTGLAAPGFAGTYLAARLADAFEAPLLAPAAHPDAA
jgi:predicted alpha/beta-fold hydrolase